MARRGRPSHTLNRILRGGPVRAREHVIADLIILHIQWISCKCGYVAAEPERDYGYELTILTFDEGGQIENGVVYLQVKATDDIGKLLLTDGETISIPIERQHVLFWSEEPMPVIL